MKTKHVILTIKTVSGITRNIDNLQLNLYNTILKGEKLWLNHLT